MVAARRQNGNWCYFIFATFRIHLTSFPMGEVEEQIISHWYSKMKHRSTNNRQRPASFPFLKMNLNSHLPGWKSCHKQHAHISDRFKLAVDQILFWACVNAHCCLCSILHWLHWNARGNKVIIKNNQLYLCSYCSVSIQSIINAILTSAFWWRLPCQS